MTPPFDDPLPDPGPGGPGVPGDDRPRAAREINIVLRMLASPHPCPGCGDLTAASLCPACQEWGASLDYALVA